MMEGVSEPVMDDSGLAAAALAGGPEAFAPIVERYQDAVFAVALARVRDFHAAQDIAQNVLIEAYQRLGSLREPQRLGAWLRRITVHRSLDVLRQRKEMVSLDAVAEQAVITRADHELRDEVMRAVLRLSKVQRETVTLFYINGYTTNEVAEMLDVPLGTIKARLHDARTRLKEDMLHMVEDVLKSEAPREDFSRRVYEALTAKLSWSQRVDQLSEVGAKGLDGWLRAFRSPNYRHRRTVMAHQRRMHSPETLETVLAVLKEALKDRNKKVRRSAADGVLSVPVSEQRKRAELVPLVVPLLEDCSKRVRRMAAFYLLPYADLVPLVLAVKALAGEPDVNKRWPLMKLVENIAARVPKT